MTLQYKVLDATKDRGYPEFRRRRNARPSPSMLKRIVAIAVIFGFSTVAWMILASTIFYRTYSAGTSLSSRVESSWGAPEEQLPPTIAYQWQRTLEPRKGDDKDHPRTVTEATTVPLESSTIDADFHSDFRQKGLLWFSTYALSFSAVYGFQNPTTTEQDFVFRLPFPAERAVYDNVQLLVDGKALPLEISGKEVSARTRIPAGARGTLLAAYRSQGLDSWKYEFGGSIA